MRLDRKLALDRSVSTGILGSRCGDLVHTANSEYRNKNWPCPPPDNNTHNSTYTTIATRFVLLFRINIAKLFTLEATILSLQTKLQMETAYSFHVVIFLLLLFYCYGLLLIDIRHKNCEFFCNYLNFHFHLRKEGVLHFWYSYTQ